VFRTTTNNSEKAKRPGGYSEASAEIYQPKADCHRPAFRSYDDEVVILDL